MNEGGEMFFPPEELPQSCSLNPMLKKKKKEERKETGFYPKKAKTHVANLEKKK